MLRRLLARSRYLCSGPPSGSSSTRTHVVTSQQQNEAGREAYEEMTKLTDPAKRILATLAAHAEYSEVIKPFYKEMRKLHARMNAATAPLMQKRREILSGGPLPSVEEMEKTIGETSFEGLRLHVCGAAALAKPAPTLNGIFWRDSFAQIGDLEDDKIVTERDCNVLEHLLDVRCRFTVDKNDVETVLFEFEFGESAPLTGRKTIRAMFRKDASTGQVRSSHCDPLTFVSKEKDPRYKRIGKKKKSETPKYVKVKSFFHIFDTVEDFEQPPADDTVESEMDDPDGKGMFKQDAYVPWDRNENTAFIVSQLQDNHVANAINSFLLYHGEAMQGAGGAIPEMSFDEMAKEFREIGDPTQLEEDAKQKKPSSSSKK